MNKKELEKEIQEMFFLAPNGWKLCSIKADKFTDEFRKIVMDKLGNHPMGEYEYINDCACQLDGGLGHGTCGCECHKEIDYCTKKIMSIVGRYIK